MRQGPGEVDQPQDLERQLPDRERRSRDRPNPSSPATICTDLDIDPGETEVLRDGQIGNQRRILEHGGQTRPPSHRRDGGAKSVPHSLRIVPESAANTPERILTSVLLPAPLAPSRAWISPGRTVRSTERSATTEPKLLATCASRRRRRRQRRKTEDG